MKKPSIMLLESRRCIDEFSQIELITDLEWDEVEAVWYFCIQVHHDLEGKNIPPETFWYVTICDIFPYGNIKIYPSADRGITDTFYHQSNNGLISSNGLWRKGNICLKDPLETVADINSEPTGSMERIRWNIVRLLQWIEKAENESLVSEDDNFELPDVNKSNEARIIFNEDSVSFMQWEDADAKAGTVKLFFQGNNQYFIDSFWDVKGNLCVQNVWGGYVNKDDKNVRTGIWIILEQIPVVHRWQAPNTLEELKSVLEQNDISWDADIVSLLDKIRDGKRHPFLIGFPISKRFGGDPENYHWWSWMLPTISHHNKTQKGFRANKAGWHCRDFLRFFKNNRKIEWCYSENWNQEQILNRGMFDRKITQKRYAIIGAGSIGSVIAELLVRSGVWKISIIDGDVLSVGNLARHTLSMKNVGYAKAAGLKKRLEEINSHVQAKAITEYLAVENLNVLDSYDVIIDCTAKDSIINLLSKIESKKIFVSVSVGYKAERMYFLYYQGQGLDYSIFDDRLLEMTRKDKAQMQIDGLPWEGTGCWSPVFPALGCDMYLAATAAVEMLIQLVDKDMKGSYGCILQKKYGMDGLFVGYERV